MSWNLLKRLIESDVFNQNPFLSVAYLSRYADHVGIHYVLCSKLRQFSYEEIEFFLPQLCHLVISVNNESNALEEFILDLCEDSVNAALLNFWLFQTYLHDLSSNPQSEAFKTCRRLFNRVQSIVFGVSEQVRNENENNEKNIVPVTLLSSFVSASVGAPFLLKWAGPLALGQTRKPLRAKNPKSDSNQTQQLTPRSNSMSEGHLSVSECDSDFTDDPSITIQDVEVTRSVSLKVPSTITSTNQIQSTESKIRPTHLDFQNCNPRLSISSLPTTDLRSPSMMVTRPSTPITACQNDPHQFQEKKIPYNKWPFSPPCLSEIQKVRLLRENYFRCETQFITALVDISNRLVVVPKPARLSALRAELALISQDLPAEVDIPVICPVTLVKGAPSKNRYHRIVRLNPAEATVLNSAEKVPYLIMVEVLRDDFSFDPETSANQALIKRLLAEQRFGRRRIFDLSESTRTKNGLRDSYGPVPSIVCESKSSDDQNDNDHSSLTSNNENISSSLNTPSHLQLSPGDSSFPHGLLTPKIPNNLSSCPKSPKSPILRRINSQSEKDGHHDQTDFSKLATHMRTASQMLAQLENTTGKRPKQEVAAICDKIIASMLSLEEKNFLECEETQELPLFNAVAKNSDEHAGSKDMGEKDTSNDSSGTKIGAARMENDQKTSGFKRIGDRDDPSVIAFGEAWSLKKERIRKSSPYGWKKNWDLLSVIVKTGADLRQEAFACQLIQVCHDIWKDAKVLVWVERMRILVTGESSGLIETITNGVSLHSLKRSLTLATIQSGQNPRRRIASLKDHFRKAFGQPESETYQAAVDAFKRSLASYSIICYILQLKDRHNGNVLLDTQGHIIHIDFGFMLSNSPGSVGFEAAPFKLTQEYVDVLGGVSSEHFEDYKKLCKQAFQALRRSADKLIDLVIIMGRESKMPCFSNGVQQVVTSLRQRFQLQLSADEAQQFVEIDLIGKSLGSYFTRLYDTFQYRTQDIY